MVGADVNSQLSGQLQFYTCTSCDCIVHLQKMRTRKAFIPTAYKPLPNLAHFSLSYSEKKTTSFRIASLVHHVSISSYRMWFKGHDAIAFHKRAVAFLYKRSRNAEMQTLFILVNVPNTYKRKLR
jgi:hypothetical protein